MKRIVGRKTVDDHKDPLHPSPSLLCKIGSIVVHVQEHIETKHPIDMNVATTMMQDPEVKEWMNRMRKMALLPVKR